MVPIRRISALALTLLVAASVHADTPPINRIPLERSDVPESKYVAIVARVEAQPGAQLARHVHPGVEMTTCISGELDLLIDGKPPRHIVAGEHFQIPVGVVHAISFGAEPAVLIATFVVEKDKPLSSPP